MIPIRKAYLESRRFTRIQDEQRKPSQKFTFTLELCIDEETYKIILNKGSNHPFIAKTNNGYKYEDNVSKTKIKAPLAFLTS
jgi:hypothetical protein